MGVRGELFSSRVILPNRTYFFNVKENRMGDIYLNIVESKNRETGGFDRQSVVLFADDLQEFLKGFDESLKVLEKAVREKKRSKPSAVPRRGTKAEDGKKVFKRHSADKLASGKHAEENPVKNQRQERGKRMVVKKKNDNGLVR